MFTCPTGLTHPTPVWPHVNAMYNEVISKLLEARTSTYILVEVCGEVGELGMQSNTPKFLLYSYVFFPRFNCNYLHVINTDCTTPLLNFAILY